MKSLRFKIIVCLFLVLALNLELALALQDKLVAIVNDEIITESDVKEFLNILFLQLSAQYEHDELDQKMKEAEDEAVERLIEDKLILQEAKRQGLKVDDAEIDARILLIKDKFVSDEEFDLYLKMHKLTRADLRTKISEQILMHDIVEMEVRSKIFVHPQEVTNYYLDHLDEFQEPEKIVLDSIFIRTEDSEEEAIGKIQEIQKLLEQGEDFANLRDKYSDSPALGMVKKGQLNEEIESIVFSLDVNEVSIPVQTNTGIYLFMLKERIPAGEVELEEVRDKIYQFLFEQKFQRKFVEWIDGLKGNAYIVIK